MAYACVYVLAQLAGLSSAKNAGKERAEVGFRLFWNNINQQMMDFQNFYLIIFASYIFVLINTFIAVEYLASLLRGAPAQL
jgi:hypothetical protein